MRDTRHGCVHRATRRAGLIKNLRTERYVKFALICTAAINIMYVSMKIVYAYCCVYRLTSWESSFFSSPDDYFSAPFVYPLASRRAATWDSDYLMILRCNYAEKTRRHHDKAKCAQGEQFHFQMNCY